MHPEISCVYLGTQSISVVPFCTHTSVIIQFSVSHKKVLFLSADVNPAALPSQCLCYLHPQISYCLLLCPVCFKVLIYFQEHTSVRPGDAHLFLELVRVDLPSVEC